MLCFFTFCFLLCKKQKKNKKKPGLLFFVKQNGSLYKNEEKDFVFIKQKQDIKT